MKTKSPIIEFEREWIETIREGGVDEKMSGFYKRVEKFIESRLKQQHKHTLEMAKREIVNMIVARIAVDIMETKVITKDEDFYNSGHIHGLNRALYLIRDDLRQKLEELK